MVAPLMVGGGAARAAATGWERLHATLFSNVGRESGLPHPIAMALAQDSDGFVWVGTQGGLSRYDGYRFRTFLHQDGVPGSLPGNVITALVPATAGRLWVSTATGNVARYDPATGQFQDLPEPAGQPARGGVLSMVGDGDDGIWVGTNAGLEHVDAAGAVTREAHRDGDPTSAPSDRIRALLRTRDGTLWISTVTGLMRRATGASAFTPVPLTDAHGQGVTDEVVALTQDSAGRVWFATVRSGLGRVLPGPSDVSIDPPAAGAWGPARLVPEASPQALGGPLVFCLTEGRPGEVWVGRVAGGITIIDAATGALRTLRHNPLAPTSIADDSVHALMRDRTGMLWAATNLGVSRTDLRIDAVDTLLPDPSAGGLPDANVLGITTTPDGRAWMGFKDHGAALLDPAAGTVTPLPNVASLPPGGVVSITGALDGGVWLGAGAGRALFRHDPSTGALEQHPFPGQVVSPMIYGLAEGDALWFGAGPLVRYAPTTGKATVFRHAADDPASLVDDSVNVMLPDGAGGLWVGTRHGLDRMEGTTGAFGHYLHDPAAPHSLPADLITTLLMDRHGRLWLGTLGGGIGVLEQPAGPDHPRGVFRRLTMADGLPNDNIGTLLMDGSGRVWASTADGLAVIDPETWAARALGRADGVAIPAYWIHSGAALPDGSLIFGGGGGATVVHPDRYKPKTERPPVVITAVRVAGRPVPVGTMAAPVPLRLAPGDRSVEISFAALDYSAPEDIRYAYTLSGFDESWTDADTTQRVAAYTNLPPGRYSLLIKAGNRAGDWSAPVTLSIEVLPAWWQTLWAKLAAVALALGGVVALVQARTTYLRRRRAVLEAQVARQTRDLLAANERLKDLANRDPLTEIHNRRHFMELAEAALVLARPTGTPAALLMMDIDHFKQVNDTLGHSAGDEVLLAVVARIRALLRKTDVFARLGGEELALFMPDADEDAALAVAERLRRAVGDTPYDIEGAGVIAVTVSIGVAAGVPTLPLKELLDRADHGLYAAKRAGRDRVAAYVDGNRQ
ncbi:diguanylate cyclase [Nitrospirillum sp. BR 11163]|uniref:ligand-binding sensor domain-containing diguanylate cyclase n=1 Tax=Nitrospirillum sp. BR 11163 TaxID=3104323 RepID=UPI002AFEFDEF|nr:diguanylate cyclase [Nitrospirillum sp. BR 11163]MEA1676798.1 diguanylate cyclase [Nitrospirillum sp. BR 11163]